MLDYLNRAKIVITNDHSFKRRERIELSKGGRLLLQGRGGEELPDGTLPGVGSGRRRHRLGHAQAQGCHARPAGALRSCSRTHLRAWLVRPEDRSEEHTSGLQSLKRISDAVLCLKN